MEADLDGDGKLSFEEFAQTVSNTVRYSAKFRHWASGAPSSCGPSMLHSSVRLCLSHHDVERCRGGRRMLSDLFHYIPPSLRGVDLGMQHMIKASVGKGCVYDRRTDPL
jgi:hypothetical protein